MEVAHAYPIRNKTFGKHLAMARINLLTNDGKSCTMFKSSSVSESATKSVLIATSNTYPVRSDPSHSGGGHPPHSGGLYLYKVGTPELVVRFSVLRVQLTVELVLLFVLFQTVTRSPRRSWRHSFLHCRGERMD